MTLTLTQDRATAQRTGIPLRDITIDVDLAVLTAPQRELVVSGKLPSVFGVHPYDELIDGLDELIAKRNALAAVPGLESWLSECP